MPITMNHQEIVDKTVAHVKSLCETDSTGHDWWHIYRVWQTAKSLAKAEGANLFLVEMAALLHDTDDWKLAPNTNIETMLPNASGWLESIKLSETLQHEVLHIINQVSFKGAGVDTPTSSIEAAVVQDADRLDAIGAIGVARAFAYGGAKSRILFNPEGKPTMHQSFEEYKQSNGDTISHFYEKLLLLKDRMNTQTAKELAQQRHDFMEQFLDQFYGEWGIER